MLYYKLQKNRRPGPSEGKYVGFALHPETIGTDELAERIQRNCTLTRADVVCVISALVDEMDTLLRDSKAVHLDRLGTFKIGISSRAVDQPDQYSPAEHVRDVHVLFQPERRYRPESHTYRRSLLDQVQMKELPGSRII